MAEIGSAYISILPSLKGMGSSLSGQLGPAAAVAGKDAGEKAGGGLKSGILGHVKGIAAGMGVAFAAVKAVSIFKGFIADARESARVSAITASVIKSTGGAAGLTAKQVGSLATAISNKTGIDDEQIQSNANVLLTFTNLRNEVGKGNDVFSRATGLAQDMATVMGTDAKGASMQLGKALNDPVKGVTALARAGVSFTQQQKDQIAAMVKSGDLLGAQKIVLGEVGKEFGGAAEAAATPMQKLKVTVGNLGESVGAFLIPVIDGFATILVNNVIPALGAVGGAIGAVTGFIAAHKTAFAIAAGLITAVFIPAMVSAGAAAVASGALTVGTWIATTAASVASAAAQGVAVAATVAGWVLMGVQSLLGAAKIAAAWLIAMGPIGLVIIAVVALVALIVTHMDKVKAIISAAWNVIKSVTSAVWGAIKSALSAVWGAIKTAVMFVFDAIKAYIMVWVHGVQAVIGGVSAVIGVVRDAFGAAKDAVVDKLGAAIDFVKGIPGKVTGALGNLGSLLYDKGKALIQGLIDGIMAMFGKITDTVGKVAGLVGKFLPGSPIQEGPLKSWNNGGAGKALGGLLAEGMLASTGTVAAASARMAAAASGTGGFGAGSVAGDAAAVVAMSNNELRRQTDLMQQQLTRLGSLEAAIRAAQPRLVTV